MSYQRKIVGVATFLAHPVYVDISIRI